MATTPEYASSYVRRVRRPAPESRLFCMPHPGSGASAYICWGELLPRRIELAVVQLPGREDRLAEPPFTEWAALVDEVATSLEEHLDRPFALFGHSSGALLAFEVARRLDRTRRVQPTVLIVSGEPAPQLRDPGPPIHDLPDREFLKELRRRGGTPAEVLEDEELMELLVPTLRADLATWETYRFADGEPLDCPVVAFVGDEDRDVPAAAVRGWSEQTRGDFRLRTFGGNHFFLNSSQEQVVVAIAEEMTR